MGDNFLEKLFCGRPISARDAYISANNVLNQEITGLRTDILSLEKEKLALIQAGNETQQQNLTQIDNLNKQISDLNAQISMLNAQLNQQLPSDLQTHSANFYKLPQATQTLLDAYMNKYPEAFVTYGGRYWGSNKNRYNLDVKAWLLEGQNDWEIVSKVKAAKGRISDVLAENSGLTFHQACDIAFMRVSHALGDSINYQYDNMSWGENEFWQFASESRVMTIGDCEDKSVYNFVGARIAGIPYELLRITAGMTFGGEGHATNFVFGSDLKWHHRNSTSNYAADKSLTSLPLTGDSSEMLNIQHPWFSATETKTFNWFGTEAAKRDAARLSDQPFFKFLKIVNL
jgi:hypothetical protein